MLVTTKAVLLLAAATLPHHSPDPAPQARVKVVAHVVLCDATLLHCRDVDTSYALFTDQAACLLGLPSLVAEAGATKELPFVLARCRPTPWLTRRAGPALARPREAPAVKRPGARVPPPPDRPSAREAAPALW